MLLEFRFMNYKSFLEETTFSMTAAPKQKGLDYSLITVKNKGKVLKGLCSSVIYGPNAAGKTSVIGAMETFQSIVLRGNIRNYEDNSTANYASRNLELIPNKSIDRSSPVEFFIDFIVDRFRIQYGIIIDLGLFLDAKHERKILSETLTVNDNLIFERKHPGQKGACLMVDANKNVAAMFSKSAKADNVRAIRIALDSLDHEDLFLTNGFKLIFSQKLSNLITNWLTNQFIVVYCSNAVQLERRFNDPQKHSVYVSETINNAVSIFGVNANPIKNIPQKRMLNRN